MFNEQQRKIVKKILKRINRSQICRDYGFFSYKYLNNYVNWIYKRNDKMDQKILAMFLEMQDDNFELLQEISKKNKKKL